MKILLFSDSHGFSNNIVNGIKKNKSVDMVIHLGDYVRDMFPIIDQFKNIKYEIISGNNDWEREYPSEKSLICEGKKILLTHGHHYNVKNGYQRILNKAKEVNADAVFFGHTHKEEEVTSDGILMLNPGSIGIPVGIRKTYCVVEIKGDKFWSKFESINS